MADEGISLGPFSKQLEALKWRGDSRKARPRDRRRAPAFVAGGERRGRLPTWLEMPGVERRPCYAAVAAPLSPFVLLKQCVPTSVKRNASRERSELGLYY